jgi:hypothetical protein
MDALKIDKAILAGFDWGARTVSIIGALRPRSDHPSSAHQTAGCDAARRTLL